MPFFVLCHPGQPFGAWLKRQAGEDTAAGMVAGQIARDISDESSPRDALGVLLSHGGRDSASGFTEIVRDWLAGAILLSDLRTDNANLVDWPQIDVVKSDPPVEEFTCAVCDQTFTGPFPFVVLAGYPPDELGRWGHICRRCAHLIEGGDGMYERADDLYSQGTEGSG